MLFSASGKNKTDSGLECVSWMHTGEKTPRNNIFCRRTDTATYSSMTQPWSLPLYEVSTPTVCGVSLCEAAERIFVDEADDLTLRVTAKDCNCAGQMYGSTMTTKDTSVASLTQFTGKNQSETAEVLSAAGAPLTVTTRLRTEHSLRLNSPFQRTCRKVRSLPNVSAACAHQQHLRFRFAIEQFGCQQSIEENSSAEHSGTGLRISSTGRPVAKSSGQDDTDAENPHTVC